MNTKFRPAILAVVMLAFALAVLIATTAVPAQDRPLTLRITVLEADVRNLRTELSMLRGEIETLRNRH